MAVVTRKTKGGKIYWIAFRWQGRQAWERSGTDRRAADALAKAAMALAAAVPELVTAAQARADLARLDRDLAEAESITLEPQG